MLPEGATGVLNGPERNYHLGEDQGTPMLPTAQKTPRSEAQANMMHPKPFTPPLQMPAGSPWPTAPARAAGLSPTQGAPHTPPLSCLPRAGSAFSTSEPGQHCPQHCTHSGAQRAPREAPGGGHSCPLPPPLRLGDAFWGLRGIRKNQGAPRQQCCLWLGHWHPQLCTGLGLSSLKSLVFWGPYSIASPQ